MNDSQCDRIISAIEKLTEEVDELRQAVDNLCGTFEHVTDTVGRHGCLKVRVL